MRRHRVILIAVPAASALVLGACATHAPASTRPAYETTASEPRELLPDQQVQQVLNRLAFGPRPGDVEKVRAMGVDRWIAQQLAPETIDDHATDDLVSRYEMLHTPTSQLVSYYREAQQAQRQAQLQLRADGDTSASKRDARQAAVQQNPALREVQRKAQRVVGDLQSAELARAVSSERQLQEVMTEFWENHFSVFAGKGQTRLFLAEYDRDVIRPHALGKFRDLLGAVAKSPAMLFFLDNWQSAADSTHETLAQMRGRGSRVEGRGGLRGRPGIARRPGASRPGVLPQIVMDSAMPPQVAQAIAQLAPEQQEAARRRWAQATPEQRAQFLQQAAQRRRARGLNENYARELMELHTLGVDGGYTQHDVIEVARALTGWSLNPAQGQFVFRPEMHDADPKVVLGHTLPGGRGIEDGEAVLDIVARHPSTARFITTKLARHFVSDDPPPALVDRCAGTFTKTDGDIRETVRCIVTSPEFFSRAAYRAKVKTPFEVVASALRALGAQPDTTPRVAQVVARLGQPIFGRQTPDGWPDRGDAWMNTGAILNRINFGLAVAAGRLPGVGASTWPAAAQLAAAPRAAQADGVIKAILGGEASPETRDILISGQNPMLKRLSPSDTANAMPAVAADQPTMAGSARDDRPGGRVGPGRKGQPRANALRALDRPVDLQGLAQVVGLALGAPEFQRR